MLTLDELQHLDQLREPRYEIEQELFNVDDATDAKTYRILRRAFAGGEPSDPEMVPGADGGHALKVT